MYIVSNALFIYPTSTLTRSDNKYVRSENVYRVNGERNFDNGIARSSKLDRRFK